LFEVVPVVVKIWPWSLRGVELELIGLVLHWELDEEGNIPINSNRWICRM